MVDEVLKFAAICFPVSLSLLSLAASWMLTSAMKPGKPKVIFTGIVLPVLLMMGLSGSLLTYWQQSRAQEKSKMEKEALERRLEQIQRQIKELPTPHPTATPTPLWDFRPVPAQQP